MQWQARLDRAVAVLAISCAIAAVKTAGDAQAMTVDAWSLGLGQQCEVLAAGNDCHADIGTQTCPEFAPCNVGCNGVTYNPNAQCVSAYQECVGDCDTACSSLCGEDMYCWDVCMYACTLPCPDCDDTEQYPDQDRESCTGTDEEYRRRNGATVDHVVSTAAASGADEIPWQSVWCMEQRGCMTYCTWKFLLQAFTCDHPGGTWSNSGAPYKQKNGDPVGVCPDNM